MEIFLNGTGRCEAYLVSHSQTRTRPVSTLICPSHSQDKAPSVLPYFSDPHGGTSAVFRHEIRLRPASFRFHLRFRMPRRRGGDEQGHRRPRADAKRFRNVLLCKLYSILNNSADTKFWILQIKSEKAHSYPPIFCEIHAHTFYFCFL